ncbi:MAG: hypothetical protein QXE84_04655 [Candidatus Nitrosotenuis sp.]|uniref:Uncharacterized protein n=1 Tax=Candidatus Nitrosotenuis uzonensis TaxID=1407055 RepID=A0A812EZE7_9ARCH|nr:hypothetical protein NUZ5A_51246 [Candidatus Nitrosotenuis uzonensis]
MPAKGELKIDRNDLQVFKDNPIQLFQQGIKSKVTKEKYTRVLRKF